jgi:hypothetical protein
MNGAPKKTVTEPTADRLRYDIDRGRGGDKVDGSDPAIAPLGTDDEAGGAPPTPAQIKQAYAYEIAPGPSSENVGDYGVLIYMCMVASLVTMVSLAVWLF